jgi:hypothetical protein
LQDQGTEAKEEEPGVYATAPIPDTTFYAKASRSGRAEIADRIGRALQGATERNPLYFGETPEVLIALGLKSLPMGMKEAKATGAVTEHGLNEGDIVALADAIADPVAVLDNWSRTADPGSVLVVTRLIKSDGTPVIVPVAQQGLTADIGGKALTKTVNAIKTAYPAGALAMDAIRAKIAEHAGYVDMKTVERVLGISPNEITSRASGLSPVARTGSLTGTPSAPSGAGGPEAMTTVSKPISRRGQLRQHARWKTILTQDQIGNKSAKFGRNPWTGVQLYASRIHAPQIVSPFDYVVPETPEFEGNMTGDLAWSPQSGETVGIEQLPIRLPVGKAEAPHKGFGIEHAADEGRRQPERGAPRYTDDESENYARQAAAIAKDYDVIYQDGTNSYVFWSTRMGRGLITLRKRDAITGEMYYSITTIHPRVNGKWGGPVWPGRNALPGVGSRQPRASQQSLDQSAPKSSRFAQRTQTSKYILPGSAEDRQPKRSAEIQTKRRRAFTLPEIQKAETSAKPGAARGAAAVRAEAVELLGEPVVRGLEEAGLLRIVDTQAETSVPRTRGDEPVPA